MGETGSASRVIGFVAAAAAAVAAAARVRRASVSVLAELYLEWGNCGGGNVGITSLEISIRQRRGIRREARTQKTSRRALAHGSRLLVITPPSLPPLSAPLFLSLLPGSWRLKPSPRRTSRVVDAARYLVLDTWCLCCLASHPAVHVTMYLMHLIH
ncbi:uncharacterized protein LY79DRAFT_189416 [Colletotrichum navitas]|uniref:Uncharacterized protein n=1 Tax=Colletotrichum navitas TaxID=681940 RepID=A0AAD8Q0M0_9PEZI|nr:uncharacterized protein LY79DRAFT_189416 [Colletotrichum navitas]KAK1593157.1 hypothetical protein LY79DRAFT_189416 [Colletotrichum navitas]